MVINENINVVLTAITKGFNAANGVIKQTMVNLRGYNEITANQTQLLGASIAARQKSALQYKTMGKAIEETTSRYSRMGKEVVSVGTTATKAISREQDATRDQTSILAASIANRQRGNAVLSTNSRNIGILDSKLENASKVANRFKMEYLGIMFAGMALTRSMGKILRPAAQSVGIFEEFSDILTDAFSPIMEAIMPMVEKLSDFMDSLSDGTKMFLGVVALLILGLGLLLSLVGQGVLAYTSLSMALGRTSIVATSASGSMFNLGIASKSAATGLAAVTATSATAATGVTSVGVAAGVAGTTAQVALFPFLPIMYAIAAIVLLLVYLFYNWEDVVDSLSGIIDKFGVKIRMMATSAVLFLGWMGDKMSSLGESFSNAWEAAGESLTNIWEGITTFLSDTWENIKNFFIGIWTGMINWFKGLWTGVSTWFSEKLTGIWEFFKNTWTSISTWFSEKLTSIWKFFRDIWDKLSTWFSEKLTSIKNFFIEKWTSIKTWFSEHLNSVSNFFKDIWNKIHTWFSEKLDKIKETFSSVWNSIKDTASSVWGGITGVIKGAINIIIGLINKLTGAWNSLSFTVPKIKIPFLGTFGGGTYGVPQIPNIPYLANGGIVSKPTLAMIGEKGPEAVVPLGKGIGQEITFSPVYNITVADKYEFERMIKFNNTKMVEDLRRLINT